MCQARSAEAGVNFKVVSSAAQKARNGGHDKGIREQKLRSNTHRHPPVLGVKLVVQLSRDCQLHSCSKTPGSEGTCAHDAGE